ncbi:hypothetical protein F4Z99_19840 [Candidatus Poribacteria bacterium]|nr:hypothetical protein [Candidatus Poribacteria bacterium]MYB01723.1 hypothetical protein [Candidatus Poribacteria bacterium]
MISLSSLHSRNWHASAVSIPVLAISILLAAIFIASCGDEGDITEDTTGMTDVLQPTTTPEPQPEEPVVIEEPVVVEEPKVSFKDDIQPILAERCAIPGCHVAGHFTGLDLSKYDPFKKGGNGGAAFVAGNGEGSLVVKRIDGGGMPPGGPPLDADQIQLFIDWIDEGAENN